MSRLNRNNNIMVDYKYIIPSVLLLLLLMLININLAEAQNNKNNFFCGSTWADASNNCNERQHCPGASDEECGIPGHICFADTLCDSSKGHGSSSSAFGNLHMYPFYDNVSNTKFCQGQWNMGTTKCSTDLWCGDDSPCPEEDMICFYSDYCHIHDLMEIEMKQDAKNQQNEHKQVLIASDPNDPIRNMFCGKSWDDASVKCGAWCSGEESECPFGEGCFADTTCYSDAGLVPSPAPTTYAPTSRAPTSRLDPRNFRFCGSSWQTSVCSIESHCPTGLECENGETCFTKQTCNVHDLTRTPTFRPTTSPTLSFDNPMYLKFCGKSYEHATMTCGLKTHCVSDDSCPAGASCFENLPGHCNAFYMEHPEFKPETNQPTLPIPTSDPTFSKAPSSTPTTSAPVTKSPTVRDDPRNKRFCGTAWDKVVCSLESHCPTGLECQGGEICFTKYLCNVHDLTETPIFSPSSSPIQPRDHTSYLKFCGTTVAAAVLECSLETHCGLDGTCPPGTSCFNTPPGRCNGFDMRYPALPKAPSLSPTTQAPSMQPTTSAPVTNSPISYDDPMNTRFCGRSWDSVTCSIASHCPDGLGCPNGEQCFYEKGCNIEDLKTPTANPSILPPNHPSYFTYCGNTLTAAVINCSLETLCSSDESCPAGASCFDNLPQHCNAFYMLYPSRPTFLPTPLPTPPPPATPSNPAPLPTTQRTRRPTHLPTPRVAVQTTNRTFRPTRGQSTTPEQTFRPTLEPSQSSVVEEEQSTWCGETQSDANRNCGDHSFWCVGLICPFDWKCFLVQDDLCGSTTADEISNPRTNPPTKRPTNVPTKMNTSKPTQTTKEPTPKQAQITKGPTPKPVQITKEPTQKPNVKTKQPTTKKEMPTNQPLEPVTKEPTPRPVSNAGGLIATILMSTSPSDKTTTPPSPVNNHDVLTPHPTTSAPINISELEPAHLTNKQPNGGTQTKPSPQSTAKENATGNENIEEKPSLAEESDTTTSNRPKLYCFTRMNNVDQECPRAMECSGGNPCPSGQFCVGHDCKNRPPSNGALDLCPFRYVGMHTTDCKSYYECDYYGYVGPILTCEEGYKFDRSSDRCISGHYVNSQCYYRPDSFVLPSESPTTTANNGMDVTLPSFIQPDSSDEDDEVDTSTVLSPSRAPTTTTTTQMVKVTLSPSTTPSSSHSQEPTPSDAAAWPDDNGEPDLSQWFRNSGRKGGSRWMNARILVPIQSFVVLSFTAMWL